jgi:hypothetical protein
VDRGEGEVVVDQNRFPVGYLVGQQGRQGLAGKTAAERALVVREFFNDDRRVGVAVIRPSLDRKTNLNPVGILLDAAAVNFQTGTAVYHRLTISFLAAFYNFGHVAGIPFGRLPAGRFAAHLRQLRTGPGRPAGGQQAYQQEAGQQPVPSITILFH